MKRLLFCGLITAALQLQAQIPELVLPAGVGVNIHFVTGHERDLDMIAAAGFKVVRMDFSWGGTERVRGQYDWSGYDQLTANMEKRGLQPLYILDYSNGLYEEEVASKNPIGGQPIKTTASPQKPESVAAFARWAGAAAKHFAGHKILWEIWNEPNIHFWQPKPAVEQYNSLAIATLRAVRENDPKAIIIGPATSEFPWTFLEAHFKSGALEYLDAVSVHPYRDYSKSPETVAPDYAKLRALIDQYAPAARKGKIPIISGEWGYSTSTKGVSLEKQAAFAVRQQLVNLLHNVPVSIWYDWKNDGPDPNEWEHNFGTVTADLKPKPSYTAISMLTTQLKGCKLQKRLKAASEEDYLLLFQGDGHKKLAMWTSGKPHEIELPPEAGRPLKIQLDEAVKYMELDN